MQKRFGETGKGKDDFFSQARSRKARLIAVLSSKHYVSFEQVPMASHCLQKEVLLPSAGIPRSTNAKKEILPTKWRSLIFPWKSFSFQEERMLLSSFRS